MSLKSIIIHGVPLACAAAQAGASTVRIQLFPMGTFEAAGHGKSYRIDDLAHAQAVVDATRQYLGATDLMIDYDHQQVFGAKPGVGGNAPAAGWIKPDSLTAEATGIWGDVEWTPLAGQRLADREYRYISPTFIADPTGRVLRIFNAALVNVPAVKELAAAAAEGTEGTSMSLKTIAAALGLGDDATEATIATAIGALKTTAASVPALATALGLKDNAKPEDLVAAAAAAKAPGAPDPAQFAPMSLVTELQGQLKTLQDGGAKATADSLVAAAMQAGKVTPAQKDWATSYAMKDPAGFEAYVAAAAVILAPEDRLVTGRPPGGDLTTLTADEKMAARLTNISEEKFLASKKALAEREHA